MALKPQAPVQLGEQVDLTYSSTSAFGCSTPSSDWASLKNRDPAAAVAPRAQIFMKPLRVIAMRDLLYPDHLRAFRRRHDTDRNVMTAATGVVPCFEFRADVRCRAGDNSGVLMNKYFSRNCRPSSKVSSISVPFEEDARDDAQ